MRMRREKLQQQSTGKLFQLDNVNYEKSFLCAVKPGDRLRNLCCLIKLILWIVVFFLALFLAQLFGLFPVAGVNSKDPKDIKFTWKSFRALFSMCFVVTSLVVSFMVLYRQCQAGPLSPSNIVGVLFFFNCAMICILLFRFSTKFGDVMQQWQKVENSLETTNSAENSSQQIWSIKRQITVCLVISLTSALIEHLLSLASLTRKVIYEIEVCNWTQHNFFRDFVTKHLYFAFSFIEYNHFYGILAEYLNVSFTFYWSFLDIFIMVRRLKWFQSFSAQ